MAGAADSRIMTETIPTPPQTIAARHQRLDRMLDLFPEEVARAVQLAAEQAAAIAALAVSLEQMP